MRGRRSTFVAAVSAALVFAWGAPEAALAAGPEPASGAVEAAGQPLPEAPPQYFSLTLPAGSSLISAPLDSGQAIARNAFLGLPQGWPYFLGWDPLRQEWITGDTAPMTRGGGYWVFAPAPMTLLVAGQPYGALASLTRHVEPGWHLFGVPFREGIAWKDFRLYASGNPVSLETAIEMGWVESDVTGDRGSEIVHHQAGQPFQPGWAYWLRTNVPLDVRAERSAGSAAAASPVGAQAAGQGVRSTSSDTMGWLASIAKSLVDVFKGCAQVAQGNMTAATFMFSAGGMGLVEHGLAGGDGDVSANLTEIDGKLDALIQNVAVIENQLKTVESEIAGLETFINGEVQLGIPLANADNWLTLYYRGTGHDGQSREWARWQLAGCTDYTLTACPEANNPVTPANLQRFVSAYIAQYTPGVPLSPSVDPNVPNDNFPVYWAYGVNGELKPGIKFDAPGSTASGYETAIFNGMTGDLGTAKNGLLSYVTTLLSFAKGCAADVTDPACDLYANVYLPFETFFVKAISTQSQLVAAQAEAWNVLGMRNPAAWGGSGARLMTNFNQELNQEAEAFLQAVEQLALVRAADGRNDWGNFGSTDAGQALARADFLVAQLVGTNWQTPGTQATGYYNPPWPASAVVGRVFYVDGEPPLASTATRDVCPSASGAFCATPAFRVGETIPTYVDPDGDPAIPMRRGGAKNAPGGATGAWPYLKWMKSVELIGTPTSEWTIQRLVPSILPQSGIPAGLYLVNSTARNRLGAALTVAAYDSHFDSVTPGADGAVWMGSLNAVEGAAGRYALPIGDTVWTVVRTGDTAVHTTSETVDTTVDAMTMTYTTDATPASNSATWTRSAKVKITSTPPNVSVHVSWPATSNTNINSYDKQNTCCPFYWGKPFYTSISRDLRIVSPETKPVLNLDGSHQITNMASVQDGTALSDDTFDTASATMVSGTEYTFSATFSSTVNHHNGGWDTNVDHFATTCGSGPSRVIWNISSPLLTLVSK